MHRFHVDNLDPPEVALPPGEAHHAVHVLRLREGEPVELFDGRGGSATGRATSIHRNDVRVAISARVAAGERPRPRLHLGFAVPKGKRLDWLLEKATELAAASLTPVVFERSVAGPKELAGGRRGRWLGHCVSAAKQSGLDWLPELREPLRLADLLASERPEPALLGDAGAEARPIAAALAGQRPLNECLLLVGPEGGLTDGERRECLAAGLTPARLGRTILRIETAAVALLAAGNALAGREAETSASAGFDS